MGTLCQDLELMTGANPEHRIVVSTGDELETVAEYVNRLADASRAVRTELEEEVATATRTIALGKEKLASILFGLSDGVIVCDRELRVILCNRIARHLLTTSWKPARRGRGIYAYLDAARLKPLVDALHDKSHAIQQGTFTMSSGAIISATAVALGEDEERNYIFLLRDITQLVNLDRQRNRAIHETLQHLRGPLSSLVSFTDILLDYRWLDDARRMEFLKVMREEAGKLSHTLDEMQAQAEVTLSPIEWSMEEADIGAFAREAAEQLQPIAEQRVVQISAVGDSAIVRGDALSLQQLVRRLFEFSLGFSDEGGQVEARWQTTEDGWLKFSIAHQGRTLTPEETESIFENPLYVGSGDDELPTSLEVTTIREIIKQHGGETWAKNSEHGAALSFILPVRVMSLAKRLASETDTVGKQVMALLGDGAFYDFRLPGEMPTETQASTLLSQLSCVVLDLETTGLYPGAGDEIIAVAGIRIERGEIVKEDYFYSLVNPRRQIPPASTRVHGITNEMVADQPVIEDVLPKFLQFQGDSLIAGHFISFDLGFLKPSARAMGLPFRAEPNLDTLLLSYALFRDWETYNLEDIAAHLGIKVVARHNALGDAYVTAQILVQLFRIMEGRGITTLGEALRLQTRDLLGRFLHLGTATGGR
jgi:DNA polymerase-3 subunit epsilon